MRCPSCQLINPPTAQRCDCGYDFAQKKIAASFVDEARARHGGASTARARAGWLVHVTIAFTTLSWMW